MKKISFLGKIFPSGFPVTFPPLTFQNVNVESGVINIINVKIESNAVRIDCEINKYTHSDLVFIHKRVFDTVKSAINIWAFATGIGYSLIIDEVIDEYGVKTWFAPHDERLSKLCTVLDKNEGIGYDLLNIVCCDPRVFIALDELITSITVPHVMSVNFARAVEGIRQIIQPNKIVRNKKGEEQEEAQWGEMHKALNTSVSYVKLITDNSKKWRHGNRVFIGGEITTEVGIRSWIIMNRFLEYLKRGKIPLPIHEFPLL